MSSSVPPSAGGPEYLEQGAGAPLSDSGAGRGRRTAWLVGGGVGALAVVGAGVWAGVAFFSAGTQPTEALPASTLGYVSVDLDPSGQQQIEAFRTLRKFPGFTEEFDVSEGDDPAQWLFELLQDEGVCTDLDYGEDVDPWLGSSAAVAAVDLGRDEPTPAVVLALDDPDAAQSGREQLLAGNEDAAEEPWWAIAGDWAVLAETEAQAEEVAAEADSAALSDDADHQRWMEEVGDLGMAALYIAPGDAYARLVESMPGAGEQADLESLSSMLEDFNGAAGTIRFNDGGMELAFVGDTGIGDGDLGLTGEAGDAAASLPSDTVLAYSVSADFDKLIESYGALFEDALASEGTSLDELWSAAEQQTGLAMPEDLVTLLGESVTLAVGGDFDFESAANSADGSDIPVGVRVQGDTSGIEGVLDKVRPQLGEAGASFVGSDTDGDLVAVGPNPDYRSELLAGGDLGGGEVYQEVLPETDGASTVMFVDFDGADGWLVELAGDADPEVAENLEPLSALGISGSVDGSVGRMLLRLTTD